MLVGLLLWQVTATAQPISFSASGLQGISLTNPTSLEFGPDGRLYVSEQDGTLKVYTIERQAANNYVVTATETITLIKEHVPNHEDDGSPNGTQQRQVTGILLSGTAANPVMYVSSSDWRISVGVDSNLDTNSGVISRLSWIGNGLDDPGGYWEKVDLVRGLPRSEENHASNGMQLDEATQTLYVIQGGHTNKGAPGNNFAQTPEYALSAALLSIDLNAINALPVQGSGPSAYVYDLPTLDDPTRGTPGQPDPGDPFGGNDGRNQARIVPGGPVQVYSPGYRNAYDVLLTTEGKLYTFDNGPNSSWGGLAINCSNQTNESGSTGYGDQLHYIAGPGYYGGHPNPTRGNPQNSGLYIYEKNGGAWTLTDTYDWATDFPEPPVPFDMANAIECTYLVPGAQDGALAIINASTNGLAEYTASNFGQSMKGNLLAASFDGNIYRFQLNEAGTQVSSQQALLSGFGSQPLDVTAQGDGDPFPGTIWAATYGANNITVFEPTDFVECSGQYSTTLDDDGDGYSNADEVDNGTDPCSAGSKPQDQDGDLLSDLSDPDDDNDGIDDVDDAFAIDASNGLNTYLPIAYDLFNYDPGTGFFGLGFTGLMYNGSTDYLDQFDPEQLATGGASGLFTVETVTEGDAFQGLNQQENAFQFGVNVHAGSGPFSISVRMNGSFLGDPPGNYQSQGLFIGTGSQDDYLKFVVTAQSGGGLELLQEVNGIANGNVGFVAQLLEAAYVDLILDIDPATGMYINKYAVEGGEPITMGGGTLEGATLQALQSTEQALAVGIIASSNGPAPPFAATWDRIDITGQGPTALTLPAVRVPVGSEDLVIELNDYFEDDQGDENLTYTVLSNTTTGVSTTLSGSMLSLSFPNQEDQGTIEIRATDASGYTADASFDVSVEAASLVLYRVNAGGSGLASTDDGPSWDPDTVNLVSPYHNGVSNVNGFPVVFYDNSVPTGTPVALFNSERWDPAPLPEMNWTFPAEESGTYEVRLYFANGFEGTSSPGQRVFHVVIEGDTVLEDFDIVAEVGHLTGMCKTFQMPVEDGNLDISFIHQTENPLINGIEVMGPGSQPASLLTASPNPLHFFSQEVGTTSAPQTISLHNEGATSIILASAALAGNDADQFAHDFSGEMTLPAGESTELSLTFSPTSTGLKTAELSISHDGDNPPLVIPITGEGIESAEGSVLFRVNAGGPVLSATDAPKPDWTKDDATGASPYVSGNTNVFSTTDPISLNPSVPSYVPESLFQTERWDPPQAPEMTWDFPIPAGTPVEIRLYFAELFLTEDNNQQNGPRIFDVAIDGNVPQVFSQIDVFAAVGHDVGLMKAYQTTSDGNLDIDFLHVSQNPAIKGIEILDLSTPVENEPPQLLALSDQQHKEGDVVSLQIDASDPDGDVLGYSAINLPPGLDIDPASGLLSGTVEEDAALGSPYESVVFVTDSVNPAVSDTLIWVITAPDLPTSICLNAGGDAYTDTEGRTFMADDFFTGSLGTYSISDPIEGTQDDVLFQSERYGPDFAYNLPLADGLYEVSLYFAEIYHGVSNNLGANARVFSVELEGNEVLTDYDIFATADAANGLPDGNGELYAQIETFTINVSGGTLDLRLFLGANGADNAKLSAICVLPASPNQPPLVDNPGDQENTEGDAISLAISASDPDGDDLTFSASGLPTGLSIDPNTGIISGTIALGTYLNSPFQLTVSASDGQHPPVPVSFKWVVNRANQPPLVDNPGDQENTEGDAISLAISASDPDGDDLTFGASGLPTGLSIDPNTGIISGTIALGTYLNSPFQLTVSASDGQHPPVPVSFKWVVNRANQPPLVDNPGDQENTEGDAISLAISASDPDGDDLTFGASGLPTGLSIDPNTGIISGTIALGTYLNSPFQLTVSASDGQHPPVPVSFTWVVNRANQPPLVDNPGDQENTEGDAISLAISASDPDGDDLTFGASGLPTGLSIDPNTGIISGTIALGTYLNSPFQLTVSASDGQHPPVPVSFTWVVNRANQPPLVDNPGDQENTEGDAISLAISASDPDGDDLTFSASGLPTGLSIDPNTGIISGTIAEGTAANSPFEVMISVSDGVHPAQATSFYWVISPAPTPAALLTINAGGGIGASTFGNNAFLLTNESTEGLKLSELVIDLRSSLLPDLVFDPVGNAGDVAGKCFTANNGASAVGVVIPGNACKDPFDLPRDGGYDRMRIQFGDFDPGETFGFSVDIDPTSIQGATGTGVAGSISGLELSGAKVLAVFENGDTLEANPFFEGSQGGSQACFIQAPTEAPVLSLPAIQPPANERAAVVDQPTQTVRVSGPVGANVSLLRAEAGLFLSEVNGNGFDIDPFEGNQVLNLETYSATIGTSGHVDVEVNLQRSEHPEWATGFNYLMAAFSGPDDCSGLTSQTWVLLLEEENLPPVVQAIEDQTNVAGTLVNLLVEASDPEGEAISFTATGLPPGLDLDLNSGLISGTISLGAAANSPYLVTVAVTDGEQEATISFAWNVLPANQPPVVVHPGDQYHVEADNISFALDASDPDGDALSFEAFNLPTGLAINPNTGVISGTVALGAAENSPFAVQVEVSDGTDTTRIFFDWFIKEQVITCELPEVQGFVLVNAAQHVDMGPLLDGDILDLDVITHPISIRADVCGTQAADSVVLTLVEDTLHRRAEELAPYALYGDINGTYFPWPASPGTYTLKATPYLQGQALPTSASIEFHVRATPSCPDKVLFVVADGALNDGDMAVYNHLISRGFGVEVLPASQAQAANTEGISLIMISATVFSAYVGTRFTQSPIPVITWESYLYDDLGMTGNKLNVDYQFLDAQSRIRMVNPTHPLAAGLAGKVRFVNEPSTIAWGRPLPSAEVVATTVNSKQKVALFGYETGSQLQGLIAPARRVGFPSQNATMAVLNEQGWDLFDAAVDWAIDCEGLNQAPEVSFVRPETDTLMNEVATLPLTVKAFDPDGSLASVDFYVNGNLLATLEDFPFTTPWAPAGNGTYQVQAIATDAEGKTATAQVQVQVAPSPPCQGDVLMVTNTGPLSMGDALVKARMEALGFTVKTMNHNAARPVHAKGKVLVVISSSVDSWRIEDRLNAVDVPLICYEAFLYDNLGMTGPVEAKDYHWAFDQQNLEMIDPAHPMAGGYTGQLPVLSKPETFVWGVPYLTAQHVASIVGMPQQAAIFGYEAGSLLGNGFAPARRVGLFIQQSSVPFLTQAGWELVEAAIFWAIGGPCEPQASVSGNARLANSDYETISGKEFAESISVFPNPAQDHVQLSMAHEALGTMTITVRDMNGRTVYQQVVEKDQTRMSWRLSTQQLPEGTYVIQVNQAGLQAIVRLVKLR